MTTVVFAEGLNGVVEGLLAQCPIEARMVRLFWHTRDEQMANKKAQMGKNRIDREEKGEVQHRIHSESRSGDWCERLRRFFQRKGKKSPVRRTSQASATLFLLLQLLQIFDSSCFSEKLT